MKKTLILLIIGIISCLSLAAETTYTELNEQKRMIDALRNFIDDSPAAADEMEYIIQKREEAARLKANELLEKMAQTTNTVDRKEELSDGALDFVTKKLNLALVYFYESKYWLAVEECSYVLSVDPKNTLAWTRRGSGYFMLGKYEQAKKDWNIALALNPLAEDRKDIEKYLAKINQIELNRSADYR